jgi:hypothetical protein
MICYSNPAFLKPQEKSLKWIGEWKHSGSQRLTSLIYRKVTTYEPQESSFSWNVPEWMGKILYEVLFVSSLLGNCRRFLIKKSEMWFIKMFQSMFNVKILRTCYTNSMHLEANWRSRIYWKAKPDYSATNHKQGSLEKLLRTHIEMVWTWKF